MSIFFRRLYILGLIFLVFPIYFSCQGFLFGTPYVSEDGQSSDEDGQKSEDGNSLTFDDLSSQVGGYDKNILIDIFHDKVNLMKVINDIGGQKEFEKFMAKLLGRKGLIVLRDIFGGPKEMYEFAAKLGGYKKLLELIDERSLLKERYYEYTGKLFPSDIVFGWRMLFV